MATKKGKQLLLIYIVISIVGLILYKLYSSEIAEYVLAHDRLLSIEAWSHTKLGVLALSLSYLILVVLSVPVAPLYYLIFGYVFGAFDGAVLGSTLATIGAVFPYLLFRHNAKSEKASKAIPALGKSQTFFTLFILRSSPWFPSSIVTAFCGVFDVGIRTLCATSWLGTFPLVYLYSLTASKFHESLSLQTLQSKEFLLMFTVLSVVSVLGFMKPIQVVIMHLATKSKV